MNAPTYPFPERDPLQPIVAAYVRPVDLPLSVQTGLLTLNFRSELSRLVVDQLFAAGNKRASYSDYCALVTLGYAWKPADIDFHRITARGRYAVEDVALFLARKLDIHHFTQAGAGGRFERSLSCSCGWSCGLSLNAGHVSGAARYAMKRHLDEVAAVKLLAVVVVKQGVVS